MFLDGAESRFTESLYVSVVGLMRLRRMAVMPVYSTPRSSMAP